MLSQDTLSRSKHPTNDNSEREWPFMNMYAKGTKQYANSADKERERALRDPHDKPQDVCQICVFQGH